MFLITSKEGIREDWTFFLSIFTRNPLRNLPIRKCKFVTQVYYFCFIKGYRKIIGPSFTSQHFFPNVKFQHFHLLICSPLVRFSKYLFDISPASPQIKRCFTLISKSTLDFIMRTSFNSLLWNNIFIFIFESGTRGH